MDRLTKAGRREKRRLWWLFVGMPWVYTNIIFWR